MDGPDRLTSLPKMLLTTFLLFSITLFSLSSTSFLLFSISFPLSSSLSSSSPSLYFLPFLHGYIRQHLRPPLQHLRLASPSLRVSTSGHGSLASPSLASTMKHMVESPAMVRPWSHLGSPLRLHVASPTMVASRVSCHGLVSVMVRLPSPWLRLVFPSFPFTVLLKSGFKSLFFFKFYDFWDLLWLFNEYICSMFFPWQFYFLSCWSWENQFFIV